MATKKTTKSKNTGKKSPTKRKHPLAGVPKSAAHKKKISEALKAHHASKKKQKKPAKGAAKSTRPTASNARIAKVAAELRESITKMTKQLNAKSVSDSRKAALKEQIRNAKNDIKKLNAGTLHPSNVVKKKTVRRPSLRSLRL